MCYDVKFFNRARIAALLRREKQRPDELKQHDKAPAPAVPAEPEKAIKEEEPAPV
jgi:hypothetical protein